MFISFEGGEGCGKTTQIALLHDWLTSLGHPVIQTREPGGTALGQALRTLLLDPRSELGSTSELLLYAADRAEHVERVVRPALTAGRIVLCDRFSDSTVAYQGYGRRLDLALIERLNRIATGGLTPDLTFWLKLDARTGLERRRDPDRFEAESLAFHRRIEAGFAELALRHPERIRLIDASLSVEQTARQIRDIVDKFLNKNQSKLRE
ncbi:dTMP kinase [Gloeobacter kilaueensis]|uniref:Thymidylate kinase n=1 Tax=Gloeobacter kilaueensis (strain ATCC BAA-2537 / CCAP 1431/1 / ULC 316 / JS1) TaxID=1183438 RepID=U5QMF8_GLOK1|nr:dTMP kinase [Gloeobacter kilaueensis]AGY60106.1 thymidylate kinase [Gloeobacter kilaueensis JS1]